MLATNIPNQFIIKLPFLNTYKIKDLEGTLEEAQVQISSKQVEISEAQKLSLRLNFHESQQKN